VTLSGGSASGLSITETFRPIQADLIERVVRVTANSDQRFFLELGWRAPEAGDFYSFMGKETTTQGFSLSCGGPEFAGHSKALHTFPRLGLTGDDPLATHLDRELGVGRRDGYLVLDPGKAKLRPPAKP
jgi:hypothetical protein